MGSVGIGLASHFQPSTRWVPSQNGRLDESPQRQSETVGLSVRSHSTPFASTSVNGPSTRYGPFGRTVILTGGAPAAPAATASSAMDSPFEVESLDPLKLIIEEYTSLSHLLYCKVNT